MGSVTLYSNPLHIINASLHYSLSSLALHAVILAVSLLGKYQPARFHYRGNPLFIFSSVLLDINFKNQSGYKKLNLIELGSHIISWGIRVGFIQQ